MSPDDDDEEFTISSPVWGILRSTSVLPAPGDGFAFYHSKRALFPAGDVFGRKPRISLMGELLDIDLEGRNVLRIEVSIQATVFEALQSEPIVRDETTRYLFVDCGIVPGAVATMYPAPAGVWEHFCQLLDQRLP
jgi:hypothetical protein